LSKTGLILIYDCLKKSLNEIEGFLLFLLRQDSLYTSLLLTLPLILLTFLINSTEQAAEVAAEEVKQVQEEAKEIVDAPVVSVSYSILPHST
jgi:inner membrane protein involved in colicin E2 resistance